MNFRILSIFILFCCVGLNQMIAQPDPLAGKDTLTLENERVEDVKDSNKPFVAPPYQEIKKGQSGPQNYFSKDFYIQTDFEPAPPQIKPLPRSRKEQLLNNYLKLGLGRFVTPYAKLYLNNGRDQNVDYGFDFTHISAHNDTQIPLRRFRQNEANAKLKFISDAATVNGGIHIYNTSYFNYADTAEFATEELREDALRNGFTRVKIGGNVVSNYDPRAVYDYNIGTNLKFFNGNNGNRDLILNLSPNASYFLGEKAKVGIETNIEFMTGKTEDLNQARIFLDALPYFSLQGDQLQLRIGPQLNFFNNNADTSSVGFAGIVAEVSYEIVPDGFAIQAGYLSGMTNHTYYDLIYQNPYMQRLINLRPSVERLNVYGGIKGNIAREIDFSGRIYYRRITDQPVFVNTAQGSTFDVVYDSLLTVFGFHAEVNYDLEENFKAGAAVTVNNYTTNTLPKYYNAAPLRLDVFAKYLYEDQLSVSANLTTYGSRPMALSDTGEILRDGLFVDISFGADYRINENFSVFLNLYNLLNSNYQRWHNYPERQLDFRGGITLSL
ncbi:MAG: hypothetical protein AAGD28_06920 [Bacteroidota bacterium]